MIRLRNIEKSFTGNKVLNGIDLTVDTGSVVVILGPSGSGKSTLLRSVNFLEKPSKGTIEINDLKVDSCNATKNEIQALRTRTAMVFQNFNLFKNLTVVENIMIGLTHAQKMNKTDARCKSLAMLEKVGLMDKLESYPGMLSGGQQQRVAIARALALGPEVLLFDEPTSALDPELAEDVLQCIKNVAKEGNTMLLVTHELAFAYDVADKIVLLDEGQIVEEGDTKLFFQNPKTDRARKFMYNNMKRFFSFEEKKHAG